MLVAILLSLFLVAPVSADDSFWQKITWNTSDGVSMVGTYHGASNPNSSTWVLLHGLGSGRGEWDSFARRLAAQGSGVFVYDLRGHGESNRGITRSLTSYVVDYNDWRSAGPGSPWDAMVSDLDQAVKIINEHYAVPIKKIGIGGASLGANVALVYASDHPHVPALVLLSPGINYAEIYSEAPYQKYKNRPVLIAASPADAYAYSTVQKLASQSKNSGQTVFEGSGGHGVQMFKDELFTTKLLKWMDR